MLSQTDFSVGAINDRTSRSLGVYYRPSPVSGMACTSRLDIVVAF